LSATVCRAFQTDGRTDTAYFHGAICTASRAEAEPDKIISGLSLTFVLLGVGLESTAQDRTRKLHVSTMRYDTKVEFNVDHSA